MHQFPNPTKEDEYNRGFTSCLPFTLSLDSANFLVNLIYECICLMFNVFFIVWMYIYRPVALL